MPKRESKPRMRTGPVWIVRNPAAEDGETLSVDWAGEAYRFPPGETRIKVRGNAKPEDVANQALAVYQTKGLTIRSE